MRGSIDTRFGTEPPRRRLPMDAPKVAKRRASMSLPQSRTVAEHISTAAPGQPDDRTTAAGPVAIRPRALRELLLLMTLWIAYSLGRFVAKRHVSTALHNAIRLWGFERRLHIPSEVALQRVILHSETLVHAANDYYAFVHFPATATFLLWFYLRRPSQYLWLRRALVRLTAMGLVVQLVFPLAPPRMLVDTV